jgi:hypothetical protein
MQIPPAFYDWTGIELRKRCTGGVPMLIRFISAGVIISLLTGAASAQMPMPGINLSPEKKISPEEKERQRVIENEYKNAIGQIPDKKAPADPWGSVRSSPSKPKQGQQ